MRKLVRTARPRPPVRRRPRVQPARLPLLALRGAAGPRRPLRLRPPRPGAGALPLPLRAHRPAASRAALALERRALRAADVVDLDQRVVPADRDRARRRGSRGRLRGAQRSRPGSLPPVEPDPALRAGRRHLVAYLGTMGPQDGIDHALRALAAVRTARRRLAGDVHRQRRRDRRDAARSRSISGLATWSSSSAGAATRTSAASCRPPTSASHPIRRARSTTYRR